MSAAHDIDLVWQDLAACAGTPLDWWFPTRGESGGGGEEHIPLDARERCDSCVVRAECLEHALRYERHGVWAGTSEAGRKRLRRTLRIRLDELDHADDVAAVVDLADQGTPPQRSQSSSA